MTMKVEQLSGADTSLLVDAYRAAAKKHGDEAADEIDAREAAYLIAAIYVELRRRGIEHQAKLLSLLWDIEPNVRLWSATHALEFATPQGEAVLEKLTSAERSVGLSAELTLEEWRAGKLQFP